MGVKIVMGQDEFELDGPYAARLSESNDALDDAEELRRRMRDDGYLFIRGFHDREKVLAARRSLLEKLAAKGHLAPGAALDDGVIHPENKAAGFLGGREQPESLLQLVNSPETMGFFERFLGGPCLTFDYKWVRAVGTGEYSGAHYDVVYMGRGTKNLYTMWTPLGDIDFEMGGLAILTGSRHLDALRDNYGQMDVDRDRVTGWFSDRPSELVEKYGGTWATAEFRAGDALIFGMYTMHASLTNRTNRYRLSCDTRYQLRSEPVDERWVGEKPKGHYAWLSGPTVPMEEARKKWNV